MSAIPDTPPTGPTVGHPGSRRDHPADGASRDEPVIDVPLVAALIREQFPDWADLPVSRVQPDGWDNRTFRLGQDLLVRLPSAAGYVDQVAKEQRWLPVLAPRLPLPVPVPVAAGTAGSGYRWPWSVYRWLPGTVAATARIEDEVAFAAAVAGFLAALARVDATDGPVPGPHNFFRGGALVTYDEQTRAALVTLAGRIDVAAATNLWEAALATTWQAPPVWIHGDVGPGNLLVADGALSAVIDFGGTAVGDPACDLVIAWTTFSGASRDAFRAARPVDDGTWARGRGWALWKALITLAGEFGSDPAALDGARRTLTQVLADPG